MIYQPRAANPSNSAVDALLDNNFSVIAQTNTSVIAHQLTILDFDNNLIYDNGKVSLVDYAYNDDNIDIVVPANSFDNGKNYKWNLRMYQIEKDILITYGLVQVANTATSFTLQKNINIRVGMNILVNSEYREISAYDINTGIVTVSSAFTTSPSSGDKYYVYSDFIDTTAEYVFYARETSSVVISNAPDVLTVKYHQFNGVYTQADGIPIRYHIFNLYSLDSLGNKILIGTTNQVYSANLEYYYDGFRTEQIYYIELIIENEMGIIVQSPQYEFQVLYDIVEYLEQPIATFLTDSNANRVSWVAPNEMEGFVYGGTNNSEVITPNILYQTPYDNVNSLYTNGSIAAWHSDEGLYIIPANAQISLQFSPDDQFYYGADQSYDSFQILVEGSPETKYTEGYFVVYINDAYLGVMSPDFLPDGTLNTLDIAAGANTREQIYLSEDIDTSVVKYITSYDNGWTAEITNYDSVTKIAQLKFPLTSDPQVGETLYINNYRESLMYTGTRTVFVLAANPSPQVNEDYMWDDNATWNDNYYWVEGGTPLERVCNHWWKTSITQSGVKVEEVIV